jgi:hypothetical protein
MRKRGRDREFAEAPMPPSTPEAVVREAVMVPLASIVPNPWNPNQMTVLASAAPRRT